MVKTEAIIELVGNRQIITDQTVAEHEGLADILLAASPRYWQHDPITQCWVLQDVKD